ncbi:MAG: hypothetical protein JWO57_4531 [Pseudonocardiales bacterium]|nr:hypothetical protein [Pseudonocardiales bacterium]
MPDWDDEGDARPAAVRTLDASGDAEDVRVARRGVATFGVRPDDPTFGQSVRAFARRYGWRAYALPVLVVISVLALLTARSAGKPGHSTPGAGGSGQPAPPTASGNIALKSDAPGSGSLNTVLSAAALPAGADYTKQGSGRFRVMPGTGPVVGTGTPRRYSIEVENGITGIDLNQFTSLVQSVLSDNRSWAGHGAVALQRVDSGRIDFHVSLVSPMTVRTLCGYDIPIETSCFAPTNPATGATINRVVLNSARWVRGDASYVGDLPAYRIYMINHEDGHALGHQHAHQCLPGGLAPVMMQQTLGLKSAATGKMCAANPWPFPPGIKGTPGAEQADTPKNSEFQLKND